MLQSVLICTYFMISAMYPIIESAISNGLVSSTLKKAVYVTAERRNVTDNPLPYPPTICKDNSELLVTIKDFDN